MVTEYYTARQNSKDCTDNDYLKEKTLDVLNVIESLSLQGFNSKCFSNLEEIIITRLKDLGFKCTEYNGRYRDIPYHVISW